MNLMIYRSNFIIWSLVSLGWVVITILFFELIYLQVDLIGDWTRPMMYVFQGTYFLTVFIIWGLLWENMERFPELVNRGELDQYLTKPINTQFMLSLRTIDPSNISDFTAGILLLIYGLNAGGYQITPHQIVLYLLLLVCAGIYLYATWFSSVCLSFYTNRLRNIHHLFPSLSQVWRVPQTIYSGWLRLIFTYVIPVTLAATVPAQLLLNQVSMGNIAILLIAALAMLLFSHTFFKISLKRYASASS